LHDRARTREAWAWLVLPGLLIKASDEHGSALPIEPGLDAIAHMGRSIDPRILIMGDTIFLSANIADQIRSAFHGLDLTDQRPAGLVTGRGCNRNLRTKRSRHDAHAKVFLRGGCLQG